MIEEQDLKVLKDSMIMCHFTHSIDPKLTLQDTAEMLSAYTDEEINMEGIRDRAQLIWSLCRLFNSRVWQSQSPRDTDILPPRLMNEGLPSGVSKGRTAFVSDEDRELSLDYFYSKRKCTIDGRLDPDYERQITELLSL
jgi:aldehyde:ferredoxin oxidoreductase